MRKRLSVATVVVIAVVIAVVAAVGAVVGVRLWREAHRTDLQHAASYAPADAQRLSWTDWAAVRAKVGADLDAGSSAAQLRRFLDRGYDADLTSASALVQSAPVLQEKFGFSPATVDWELFSQSETGAVVIIRPPDGADFDGIGSRLSAAGFERTESDTGVWEGGSGLLPSIGAQLTPELQYVALDAEDRLVLTSDRAGYLRDVVDDLGSGELPDGMADVVDASADALSASIYSGEYTCSALAMSGADRADQAAAAELIARAGDVDPVTGFAMSAQPDGHVLVVLAFETDEQARTNADSRAALASGPAPGQGGDFADRFRLGPVTAEDSLVRMDLVPQPGSYVLSDLSSGPLLFATC